MHRFVDCSAPLLLAMNLDSPPVFMTVKAHNVCLNHKRAGYSEKMGLQQGRVGQFAKPLIETSTRPVVLRTSIRPGLSGISARPPSRFFKCGKEQLFIIEFDRSPSVAPRKSLTKSPDLPKQLRHPCCSTVVIGLQWCHRSHHPEQSKSQAESRQGLGKSWQCS
jgi:hypothetical protein